MAALDFFGGKHMRFSKIGDLLERIPSDVTAIGTHEAIKRVATALMADPEAAVEAVAQIGSAAGREAIDERLFFLLTAALDEARMAQENGKMIGAQFIDTLEVEVDRLQDAEGLTDYGRSSLAACWERAGLDATDALSGPLEVPEGMEEAFELDLSDMPEVGPMIEKLVSEALGGQPNSLSLLQLQLSEMIAAVPKMARRSLVRHTVAHPKAILGDLGCALLLHRRKEIRQGALDGLADRLQQGGLSADLVTRLTVMRSWIKDEATRSGIDVLVREAIRTGAPSLMAGAQPKIHRAVSSLVDGSGAQSISVAVQTGSSRSLAVVLLKEGFGVKDAYVFPCSSATEQRNLLAQVTSKVETQDVPMSYLADAFAIAIADGLRTGHAPAAGLAEVVQVLGLTDLRPREATVSDIAKLMDPEGQLAALSAQGQGRLVTASAGWDAYYPMITESWYEDSDAITQAIEGSRSSAALKRALWEALEERRAYWARLIIRTAHLLSASKDSRALQFAAVALALDEGREMKKIPIMQTIFDASLDYRSDQTGSTARFSDGPAGGGRASTGGGTPSRQQLRDIAPEKPGELERLLKPARLTQRWVDGYLMGVCTASEFVPPGSWVLVLMEIAAPILKNEKTLQRILDLMLLHYNGTLEKLRSPVGVTLLPEEDFLISIWADGYLTAWDGNRTYWPEGKLRKEDKTARKLLESAANFSFDAQAFRRVIPNWLRERYAAVR